MPRTLGALACILLAAPFALAQNETPVITDHAMVVSVHHDATDAGVAVLKQGGNAVDAAVATGFALAVVHPVAGNIGGGGFMLVHLAKGPRRDLFIDYREEAPGAASRDMYLDAQHNVIPGLSTLGYKSVAVPGSVAGLAYAERHYGKLDLKAVMAPAIKLAEDGFVLSDEEAKELHDPDLAKFPESRRIFQVDAKRGSYYQSGDTFRQPELADTLRRIAADPGDFYHGEIAKKLAADMKANGGLITEADLAHYQVKERVPVKGSYHGYEIVSAPPPSAGGIALMEMLNILRPYDLAKLGDRSAPEVQLITEAMRRAYMDRTDYLGDPDFAKIPQAALLNPAYADAWRKSIMPDHPTPSKELQRPAGFLPPPPTAIVAESKSTDTTHYSVLDAEGNAVAVTTTLNNGFGSHVTANGLGFLLNDEMDDFASKQGAPNMYGLIQGPNNAIAPHHRPLSAMTPTIVLKDGKVRMVLGSPGGPRITTTVLNIFLSTAEGGLNVQQAVDAPRFHHQYLPDILYVEAGFPADTAAKLTTWGYTLKQGGHWSDGECIAVDPTTGKLQGGQDHRHHYGKAAGY
ncbi:MAG TPA: gamma-glutamyltransferase [Acidobacteriaceae bacterium]|jgi:gamma-glutamyltranspeptidase/glutathione hydrolase